MKSDGKTVRTKSNSYAYLTRANDLLAHCNRLPYQQLKGKDGMTTRGILVRECRGRLSFACATTKILHAGLDRIDRELLQSFADDHVCQIFLETEFGFLDRGVEQVA